MPVQETNQHMQLPRRAANNTYTTRLLAVCLSVCLSVCSTGIYIPPTASTTEASWQRLRSTVAAAAVAASHTCCIIAFHVTSCCCCVYRRICAACWPICSSQRIPLWHCKTSTNPIADTQARRQARQGRGLLYFACIVEVQTKSNKENMHMNHCK